MKITDKLLEHLLEMSGLAIKNNKEKELLKRQLSETLSYVDNLEEISTRGVKPAYFSSRSLKNQAFKDGEKNMRGLKREEALKLAKSTYKDFFKVKRII